MESIEIRNFDFQKNGTLCPFYEDNTLGAFLIRYLSACCEFKFLLSSIS
ncbi:hypothetical protein LEP1GSC049_4017 [Leptospira kirschneri serovar Cynopteri str. 3522 CT]|nr:hypothetical protein LEP1GSC065_0699 [Leptospira kirschneri serovar Sokoine str. RM1]EMO79053.1 hypothetical protein LEP1GSC126_3081 [Leptospira kirschneri str. 200801774]EPG48464.1 hypothetical protein LEP1GSC049_4017 [Leptospira kirschneri serovar Cynopteri str. 3522 CT]